MSKLLQKLRNKKGFTLIELIVVIAILGILAAILIPQFTGFQQKAKSSQVTVEAKQIATAADALYIEKGVAPTNTEIANLAGAADITDTNITVGAVQDGHVLFTYAVTIDGYNYTATRAINADGVAGTADDTEVSLAVKWVKA